MNQKTTIDISVGLDVAADFTWMSIVSRTDGQIGKPFKIFHNKQESLNKAVDLIKKAQEKDSTKVCCFVESTGPYHKPLSRFLECHGFEVVVINPIVTKNNTNFAVRDIHTDKVDSRKIAAIGLTGAVTPSIIPSENVLGMRNAAREYFALTDMKTARTLSLAAVLKVSFPEFSGVFSKLTTKTALGVLEQWPTPQNVLDAPKSDIVDTICKLSRHGGEYAEKKADALIEAAGKALRFGVQTPGDALVIRSKIRLIHALEEEQALFLQQMLEIAAAERESDSVLSHRLDLLQTIDGIGFLGAFTLLAEIGDVDRFSSPKALVAFCGLDPKVKQSGKFTGTQMHMSKRGSPLIRRVLHQAAMYNVGVDRHKNPVNPPLHEYYSKKCQSHSKLASLGAVSNKLCRIIFAVLRDGRSYVKLTPEEHSARYDAKSKAIVG